MINSSRFFCNAAAADYHEQYFRAYISPWMNRWKCQFGEYMAWIFYSLADLGDGLRSMPFSNLFFLDFMQFQEIWIKPHPIGAPPPTCGNPGSATDTAFPTRSISDLKDMTCFMRLHPQLNKILLKNRNKQRNPLSETSAKPVFGGNEIIPVQHNRLILKSWHLLIFFRKSLTACSFIVRSH